MITKKNTLLQPEQQTGLLLLKVSIFLFNVNLVYDPTELASILALAIALRQGAIDNASML